MIKITAKSYVMLFTFTAIVITILYLIPQIISSSLTEVKTIKVAFTNMKTKVSCSGKIEAKNERKIFYSMPLMTDKIRVKIGQKVKAGQKLIDINENNTLEALSNSTKSSQANEADALAQAQDTLTQEQYDALLNNYQSQSSGQATQNEAATLQPDVPDYITAPISGIITQINAQQGAFTDISQPVIVVTDLSKLQIKAQVDEIIISDIKLGQEAVITGDGFSLKYSGKITQIFPTARQIITASGTRTVVDVLIDIDNPGDDLKPGLSTNISIITSENPKSIAIPYEAIGQDNNNNEFVFIYNNGHAFKTYIKTGLEYENAVEITSGLKEDDIVIISPPEGLRNSQVVRTSS